MDIGLRGEMDGITTAARLRERHQVPVVFLTAHTDDATLERAKRAEPAGYLSKPFHEATLKATVTMALHQAGLDRRVRAAERALRANEERAAATLAAQSRHHQLLLQTSRDAVHVIDGEGRLREHNRAFLDHLGYTAEEARALRVTDWDARWGSAEMAAVLSRIFAGDDRFDTVHRRKDGALREVELFCAPFEEGGERLLLCSARDVTERKRAEATVREAREELRRLNHELEERVAERTAELTLAMRARDDFLSVVSHELRTPLHAMLALTEAMAEGIYGPIAPRQGEALGRVGERGQHLLGLITDILDVAKMDAERMVLDLERVEVEEVCRAGLRLVQDAAARRRQTLHLGAPPGLPAMRADARRLKQILLALLANAVKFTPENGEIGVEAAREGEAAVRLTVWDTGPGIAAEDLPRLFQRFGQLDARLSRAHGGAGLGLSLVRRLAELHGGRAEVESRPGAGSRFSVVIPAWEGEAAEP
jgi:PAS domain S-box-containing protein